jgi:NTP pyrophosphatase (non-canonical NTP hydrolase)
VDPEMTIKRIPNALDLYQQDAKATLSEMKTEDQLAMCALGLNGEASEVAELLVNAEPRLREAVNDLKLAAGRLAEFVKKHVYHRRVIDRDNLIKELGDVFWYLAVLSDGFGIKLSDVARINLEKLRARHGKAAAQFTQERKAA